jgi:hypothetical protein
LLVDPEDEPDDVEAFAADPDELDPDDPDSVEDDDEAASLFFSPEPFDDDSFGDEPLVDFAFSRLSVR